MNIIVQTRSFDDTTATLIAGTKRFECKLGRAGVSIDKHEGDGKTPVGTYPLRELYYRADRIAKPETHMDARLLATDTAWCDDPQHPDYNKKIKLPHPSDPRQKRDDDPIFDIIVVIGYNDAPVVPGKGSAIFMHVARPAFTPTAGCVALHLNDLLEVLKELDNTSHITILPPP